MSVPTTLPPGSYVNVSWADYDNDGDADLLLAGQFTQGAACRIYRNDGAGIFTDIQAGLAWSEGGAVAWGDYDNDGNLDILQTGTGSSNGITQVYHNLGNNLFSAVNPNLPQLYDSSAAWGDYDNDGQVDILLAGFGGPPVTSIFRNTSNGTFSQTAGGRSLGAGSLAWGDIDNDGRLDFIVSGLDPLDSGKYYTKLYRNYTPVTNSPPNPPATLTALVSSNSVVLLWSPATDANQTNGFSYNLRVALVQVPQIFLARCLTLIRVFVGWRNEAS